MKTLIISSCCSKKNYTLPNGIDPMTLSDVIDGEKECKINQLSNYKKPAIDMYCGHSYGTENQPGPLRKAFQCLKDAGYEFDFKIVSAGFGLIDQYTEIIPYNICFDKVSNKNTAGRFTLSSYFEYLDLTNKINTAIADYDVIVFILAGNYLKAVPQKLSLRPNQKVIFIDDSLKTLSRVSPNVSVYNKWSISKYKNKNNIYQINKYNVRAHVFYELVQQNINAGMNPFEEIAKAN